MNVDLEALAGPRDRLMVGGAVDPVTAEVIRGTMETVCFEMAMYVSRTATTPILNQSNERNATILDGKGRLAALSVGIPQFMLTSTLPVRFALDFLGVDEFHQGDVFVANDPYHGGGHLPDYNVFAPVVVDDHLVLIASIQCHHGDTGGAVPGGYNVTATDIWGEGVRWPVIKVLDRGVERRDVLYALQVNNRLDGYLGDIRAQIGAAKQAADNLVGLVERYGVDMIESAVDHMIDYAAKRFAEEVSAWPDGVYEGDAYVDHDPLGNPDIHLHVKITVDGPKLTIDYTGSDERQELQSWSTYGNTRGYTVAQVAAMMDPEIPKNEGFFNSIELIVPQGCVMNPHPGKPVSAGTHHPGADVGEVIAVALSGVLPDRAVPQTYKTGIPTTIRGVDPRSGATFVDGSAEVYAGWCNAAKGMDAWGAVSASFGNLWKATAEINESLYPHLQWSRDYRTDSGGPGQWRGGCGSHYIKEVRVPSHVYTYVVGMKYPMPGIAGGGPGRAEPPDAAVRDRPRTRGQAHGRLGAHGGGRPDQLRLRRRRRLGRPLGAPGGRRAGRRAGRVRERGGRPARLRRRPRRIARGADPGGRRGGDRSPAGGHAGRTVGARGVNGSTRVELPGASVMIGP